jgi:hypothetical protein
MLIAMLMLAAAPTAAAAPAATPAAGKAPTAKVECRMISEPGSRIPNRVCRLDKEWDLLADDAQNDLRSSRNARGIGNNPGPGI